MSVTCTWAPWAEISGLALPRGGAGLAFAFPEGSLQGGSAVPRGLRGRLSTALLALLGAPRPGLGTWDSGLSGLCLPRRASAKAFLPRVPVGFEARWRCVRGVGDGQLCGRRPAAQTLALGARAELPSVSARLSAAARVWERPPRPMKPGFQQNSIKLGEGAQSPPTPPWRGREPGCRVVAGAVGQWSACAGAAVRDRPWHQALPLTDTTGPCLTSCESLVPPWSPVGGPQSPCILLCLQGPGPQPQPLCLPSPGRAAQGAEGGFLI